MLEKTEEAIKNGQSRETGNTGREEDQQNKNVGHHYTHVKYRNLCH